MVLCFLPCERKPWFLNPGNFCLWNLESWALESGIHLKESGIPRTIGIQNPSSTDKHWFFTHKNDDFGAVSILTEWRWVARSCRRLIVIYRIGLCAILRGSVSRCLMCANDLLPPRTVAVHIILNSFSWDREQLFSIVWDFQSSIFY